MEAVEESDAELNNRALILVAVGVIVEDKLGILGCCCIQELVDDDGSIIASRATENVDFGIRPKALLLGGSIHAALTASEVLEEIKRHITSQQTNGAAMAASFCFLCAVRA